jgi:threonyl-tRNA synthetase
MKHVDYARGIVDRLVAVGIRVTLDDSDERVNAKIKVGADERIPYLLVVGGRDEEAKTVSVRQRGIGDRGAIPVDEFIDELVAEVRERRLPMAAKEEV